MLHTYGSNPASLPMCYSIYIGLFSVVSPREATFCPFSDESSNTSGLHQKPSLILEKRNALGYSINV